MQHRELAKLDRRFQSALPLSISRARPSVTRGGGRESGRVHAKIYIELN